MSFIQMEFVECLAMNGVTEGFALTVCESG